MPIELYELPGCPYCTKVTRKLDELGLDYLTHTVPAPHSQRTEVREISGQPRVPVIVDPDHGIDGMPESTDIVEYLDATYGNSATP